MRNVGREDVKGIQQNSRRTLTLIFVMIFVYQFLSRLFPDLRGNHVLEGAKGLTSDLLSIDSKTPTPIVLFHLCHVGVQFSRQL